MELRRLEYFAAVARTDFGSETTLLVGSAEGYRHLCRLLTRANLRSPGSISFPPTTGKRLG